MITSTHNLLPIFVFGYSIFCSCLLIKSSFYLARSFSQNLSSKQTILLPFRPASFHFPFQMSEVSDSCIIFLLLILHHNSQAYSMLSDLHGPKFCFAWNKVKEGKRSDIIVTLKSSRYCCLSNIQLNHNLFLYDGANCHI